MVGIYKITNEINNHCYIGQTTDINRRWREHRGKDIRENPNYPLYLAFSKYGIENFSFEVIEECKIEELNKREQYWISYYNSYKDGYNQNPGGDSPSHTWLLEETTNKIIDLLKNTKLTNIEIAALFDITDQTVSDINRGKSWRKDDVDYPIRKRYSRDYPEQEQKEQIIKDKKPVRERPEPLELARLVKEKGFEGVGRMYDITGKAIVKWCISYNIPFRKKELIEWYDKQIGLVKEIKVPRIKQVVQLDKNGTVINIYDNAQIAADCVNNGKGANHINEVCNGKHLTAYGYWWEYKE